MEKLRRWISQHGTVKQFVEGVRISRNFFYEWERGEKRISLEIASRIAEHTKGSISYEDLINFERSFVNRSSSNEPSK